MDNLSKFIISRIRAEGPVPFARFMEWCLYHPEYGYYTAGKVRIGKAGDFYTGPSVHPLFGGMVAKQLCEMADMLGKQPFTVLEIGGGQGFLCHDILSWIKGHDPALYERLEYLILEKSPAFCEEQHRRLLEDVDKGKVRWLSNDTLSMGNLSLTGCIISNELLDAFPVHRVVVDAGELKEIYVDEEEGCFFERYDRLSDPLLSSYFLNLGINLAESQKAEVNLQALKWLKEVESSLKRGFVMTVDYGHLAPLLYEPGRREGTLRCFYRHKLSDNPYSNIGMQDITSHVNFTALIREGEKRGLAFTGLVPQYRFLLAMGLLAEITELSAGMSSLESMQLRLTLKRLIEPETGMGEIFKVLIQHKGMEKPSLQGLKKLSAI